MKFCEFFIKIHTIKRQLERNKKVSSFLYCKEYLIVRYHIFMILGLDKSEYLA